MSAELERELHSHRYDDYDDVADDCSQASSMLLHV